MVAHVPRCGGLLIAEPLDLDNENEVIGRVARDRFTKDDRRLRYPWPGWDDRRQLQELNDELESIQREL